MAPLPRRALHGPGPGCCLSLAWRQPMPAVWPRARAGQPPCLCRLRLGSIGREKAGPASGCWAPRPSLVLLGSQAVRAVGTLQARLPTGAGQQGPGTEGPGLQAQARADLSQHSAGIGGDLGHQPGAVAKAWLLQQGRCPIAEAARTPLGWPLPHPFLPGPSGLFSLPGCWPSPPPTSRPPRTHTAGSRCP